MSADFHYIEICLKYVNFQEPVMDCHATARGLIPGRNSVFIELHVLRKRQ